MKIEITEGQAGLLNEIQAAFAKGQAVLITGVVYTARSTSLEVKVLEVPPAPVRGAPAEQTAEESASAAPLPDGTDPDPRKCICRTWARKLPYSGPTASGHHKDCAHSKQETPAP